MAAYSTYHDQQLTDLLRQGDQRAFTEIYNRYWTVMYAHVYKMLKDRDEAKDVVQEVFSNLWLKAEGIKSSNNVSGLLYIAARSRVLNKLEQKRVRHDYLASIAGYMTEVDETAVEQLDEQKLRAIIDYEIAQLPPKMREIFELSRKEELSHKEIGRKLNLSDQTVKKQVQNALKILKPKINKYGASIAVLFFLR